MPEKVAAEFITSSELMALALYFCLQKDGHKPCHYSYLKSTGNEGQSIRHYHLHRVYAEVSAEILFNYVTYEADKFPDTFAGSHFVIQACPHGNVVPARARLLRLAAE